jgi:glutamate-1-semialdehyde 2,1-aminomutase
VTAVPALPASVDRQERLRARAEVLFPGGVNSPVRAFRSVGGTPLLLERGRGAYVWDADGTRYLDCIGGWGPAILGHADARVIEAISDALRNGLALGATHPLEIELGERIVDRMPSIERLRFTSSGTEAAMSAVRLARAATGRDLVVTFAGGYHGHSDGLLAQAGSGVATLGIPGSAGVPAAVAAQTIVLPFNNASAATLAFAQHAGRIAAVLVEPVMANAGIILPESGFLEVLRELTRVDGASLIFDEVITGFRLGPGGAQARFGIRPDLTVLGKVIGGGMPIGAYGGRADLFELVAPDGPVYQAGTLSGHPLAMAAGIAALDALDGDAYVLLEEIGARVEAVLREVIAEVGVEASLSRAGSLLTVFFSASAPHDGAEALEADREAYGRFFRAMLRAGVLLPPSPFEAWFLSLAHRDPEVEAIGVAARAGFAAAAEGRATPPSRRA